MKPASRGSRTFLFFLCCALTFAAGAADVASKPVITGVSPNPAPVGVGKAEFTVTGKGFQPGAKLRFVDLTRDQVYPDRVPQSVTKNRIERLSNFGNTPTRWQVVVENPDGGVSAPFEFDVGGDVAAKQPTATASDAPESGPFATTREGRELLAAGRTSPDRGAIFHRLAELEVQYAGDVDFDYLYGTTAIDTGRFSRAVFVLQRVVIARPGFRGARMDLARAYYLLGDNESARREFLILKEQNPPAETAQVIAEYLSAIDRRAAAYQPHQSAFFEVSGGYDSNANGASELQSFLGIPLDTRNQATESGYYSLGLGGLMSYPLAPEWRLAGDASLLHRGYPDASFVNAEFLRVAGGVEWRPGVLAFSLAPSVTYGRLDGQDNHLNTGLDFATLWGADQFLASLNARYARIEYDAVPVQDVDTLLLGLSGQYTWPTVPRLQAGIALTAGQDEALETGSPFGRDLWGARIAGSLDFGGHLVSLSVANLNSDYDGLFLGAPRSDEQLSATLGYEWGAFRATGWTLRTQLGFVDNSSDVGIYDYDRFDLGLSVRKELK